MRLRFFVVDFHDRLVPVSAAKIQAVWSGARSADSLGIMTGRDLPVLTALCDDRLVPRLVFFLRLGLSQNHVTDGARHLAYEAVTLFLQDGGDDGGQEAFSMQIQGWPCDWRTQLAVVLDVPVSTLDRISVGGPLPVADLMGVSLRQSLRFFQHAFQNSIATDATSAER